MQLAQFDRLMGLVLALGLAGFMVGCGSGARDSSPEGAPDAKSRQELQRKAQRESRKGIGAGQASTKNLRRPGQD
jgi:hypothetical protein